jgi:hypothetical protein
MTKPPFLDCQTKSDNSYSLILQQSATKPHTVVQLRHIKCAIQLPPLMKCSWKRESDLNSA